MPLTSEPRPDLANWRSPAMRRQAFAHVPDFIPCGRIEPASAGAMALPQTLKGLDGFHVSGPAGDDLDLAGFLEATATDGIVVLKDGAVVFEAYGPGMSAERPHILMSASKSVVGLLAGVLSQRGLLAVEAQVSAYVPEAAVTPWAGATVRQLLDMRAGARLDGPGQAAYDAATGWDLPAPGRPPGRLHAFFRSHRGPPAIHGGPFAYISANTDLLGWVMERAAGRPFAEMLSEHLWAPMGAEAPAFITLDPAGAPRTTGGLCATVRDFARLGQLVAQGGARDGASVIPAGWINDIATRGDPEAWAAGEWAALFPGRNARYRSGWYVFEEAPQLLFAMGIHGQNLIVDRANQLVIAKVSSQDWFDLPTVWLTHRAVPEFRRLLS